MRGDGGGRRRLRGMSVLWHGSVAAGAWCGAMDACGSAAARRLEHDELEQHSEEWWCRPHIYERSGVACTHQYVGLNRVSSPRL